MLQREACIGRARRVLPRERKQRGEAGLELAVRNRHAVALCDGRELLVRDRLAKEAEEIRGIGQLRRRVHAAATAAEIALVDDAVESARSGAEHDPELARVLKTDGQIDARCARPRRIAGLGVGALERDAECRKQLPDLRSRKLRAPLARGALEDRRSRRDVRDSPPVALHEIVHDVLPASALSRALRAQRRPRVPPCPRSGRAR